MTHLHLRSACAALALLAAVAPAQFTWHQAGSQPSARAGHFAFFDQPRGRTTVFGGQDSPASYATDCWQSNGKDWVNVAIPALTARAHGASCEGVDGEGLLFGGRDNATGGLFAQTLRWNRELADLDVLTPAVSPPARWVTAMAFDSARHRVVLFGGGASGPMADTWEWDGTNWQLRAPAQSPPARANHAMAYDVARSRVVLYGGHNGASLGDTWVYDGTTWTNLAPSPSPGPLHDAMLAYDASRNLTVLFGGKDDSGTVKDAVWTWNGTTWSGPLAPATRPAARELGSLTYDKQRRRLQLVGGAGQGGTLLGDAWLLDGNVWTRIVLDGQGTLVEPPPRTGAIMTYSDVTNKTVLFGGYDYQNHRYFPRNDTWEGSSGVWQQRTPSVSPPASFASAGGILRSTGDLYVFPGRDSVGNSYNQQWNWGGYQWSPLTLSTPPVSALAHQAVGSLQSSLYGWVLVRVVTGGTSPNLTSSVQLIQPFSGLVAPINVPGGPGPRIGSVMVQTHSTAFAANKVWLFGGTDQNGVDHNDLWELADTGSGGNLAWTRLGPVNPPLSLRAHAGVSWFTAAQGAALILAGGSNAAGLLGDSWLFSLTTNQWSSVAGPLPSPRSGAAVIFEPALVTTLLLGGFDGTGVRNDIWDFDTNALAWHQRVTPQRPTALGGLTVYDRANHRVLEFGGANGVQNFSDLWSYDGTAWAPLVGRGTTPPPPGAGTGFVTWGACYDEQNSAMVMTNSADTWAFTSTGDWLHLAPNPVTLFSAKMVYVPTQRRCLMLGYSFVPNAIRETWAYDMATNTWTRAAFNGPPGGGSIALAYDRLRDRVVGFVSGQTWEYQAATHWQQRTPAHQPPTAAFAFMAYDETRARSVLEIELRILSVVVKEVWEWDGNDWTRRIAETAEPRSIDALVYDPDHSKCVTVAGGDAWDLSARIDLAGPGNTASPEGLRCYSQPELGQQLQLGFASPQGLGIHTIGFGPVQQPLASVPSPPACEPSHLYASLVSYLVLGTNEPNIAWNVPNSPLILGVTLVFQAVALQPAGCWRVTDALHVRF